MPCPSRLSLQLTWQAHLEPATLVKIQAYLPPMMSSEQPCGSGFVTGPMTQRQNRGRTQGDSTQKQESGSQMDASPPNPAARLAPRNRAMPEPGEDSLRGDTGKITVPCAPRHPRLSPCIKVQESQGPSPS